MAGFAQLPRKFSAEWRRAIAAAGFASIIATAPPTASGGAAAATPVVVHDAGLAPYTIVGDAIPGSLTGTGGDAARGRAIVADRRVGLCLLCHSGPFSEVRLLQGNLAPNLVGVGSRLSVGELRLRLVDAGRLNPATIMPPYYRTHGLARVALAYAGKPILDAAQIEDVVAFLATLKEQKEE
jgi:L-cysteine S-thiosulfotransferase